MIKQEQTQKIRNESVFENLLDNKLKIDDLCNKYPEELTFEELTCSLFGLQNGEPIKVNKTELINQLLK